MEQFTCHKVDALPHATYTVLKPVYIAVAIVFLVPLYAMAIAPMAGVACFLQFDMEIDLSWVGV